MPFKRTLLGKPWQHDAKKEAFGFGGYPCILTFALACRNPPFRCMTAGSREDGSPNSSELLQFADTQKSPMVELRTEIHPSEDYDEKVQSRAYDDEAVKTRLQQRQKALLVRQADRLSESASRMVPAMREEWLDWEPCMFSGDLEPSADYARTLAERDFSDDGLARRGELIQKAAEERRRRRVCEPVGAADSYSLKDLTQILERCMQQEKQGEEGNAMKHLPESWNTGSETSQETRRLPDLQTWPALHEVIAATELNKQAIRDRELRPGQFLDRFYKEAPWAFHTSSEADQNPCWSNLPPLPMASAQSWCNGLPPFPGSAFRHSWSGSGHLDAYPRDLTFEDALWWHEQPTASDDWSLPAMCVEVQQEEPMGVVAPTAMHVWQPLPTGRVHRHHPRHECWKQCLLGFKYHAPCKNRAEIKIHADCISSALSSSSKNNPITDSAAQNNCHRNQCLETHSNACGSSHRHSGASKAEMEPLDLSSPELLHVIQKILSRRPELEAGSKLVAPISEWLPGASGHCASSTNRILRHISKLLPGLAWSHDSEKSEIQVHLANIARFSSACDGM
eukprot:TRINITY_DN11042_c0_g1_i1.p1 TRINITY_DN11042_c0_g1~~TRINITY_DN11042_c0_g1_i1.p1  ORF type:complete len:566 (+),score=78.39 TRINITY_DN11042_c0_g1_i1:41-1738(+)